MRTSTLQKLPMPFMAACGLGIGMAGFLLLGQGTDKASLGTASAQPVQESISDKIETDHAKRGTRNTARLNRPGGANYRPVSKAGTRVAQAPSAPEVYSPSDEGVIPELIPAKTLAQKNRTKTRPVVSGKPERTRRTLEVKVVGLKDPETSTVPASKYSPQDTDPSRALSEAMEVGQEVIDEQELIEEENSELDPADIIMPDPEPELTDETPTYLNVDEEASDVEVAKSDAESVEETAEDLEEANSAPVEMASEDSDGDEPEAENESVVAGQLTPDESSQAKVSILNPSENKLPVWFVVDQRKVRLEPGQKFVFGALDSVLVRFSRGGEFGVEKIEVSEGTWRFSVTRSEGWKLDES